MFVETDFQSSSSERSRSTSPSKESSRKRTRDDERKDKGSEERISTKEPVKRGCDVDVSSIGLHRPGDAGFSIIAGASVDVDQKYDSRQMSGDSWGASMCRCLSCETLRVIAKLQSNRTSNAARGELVSDPVVILLDMDNYGFNQFKNAPPNLRRFADKMNSIWSWADQRAAKRKRVESDVQVRDRHNSESSAEDEIETVPSRGARKGFPLADPSFDVLDNVFVWGFYGSCFPRYHKVVPDEESVLTALVYDEELEAESPSPRTSSFSPSIWQRLVDHHAVYFTPCAGCSQAADNVLLKVAESFTSSTSYGVLLVTGDRQLARVAQSSILGDSRSHTNPNSTAVNSNEKRKTGKDRRVEKQSAKVTKFDVVDVIANRKKLVSVWNSVSLRVQKLL